MSVPRMNRDHSVGTLNVHLCQLGVSPNSSYLLDDLVQAQVVQGAQLGFNTCMHSRCGCLGSIGQLSASTFLAGWTLGSPQTGSAEYPVETAMDASGPLCGARPVPCRGNLEPPHCSPGLNRVSLMPTLEPIAIPLETDASGSW